MKQCETVGFFVGNSYDPQKRCENTATTKRKNFKFGGKGEPAIIFFFAHLCGECAKTWDDVKKEMDAEARIS